MASGALSLVGLAGRSLFQVDEGLEYGELDDDSFVYP